MSDKWIVIVVGKGKSIKRQWDDLTEVMTFLEMLNWSPVVEVKIRPPWSVKNG